MDGWKSMWKLLLCIVVLLFATLAPSAHAQSTSPIYEGTVVEGVTPTRIAVQVINPGMPGPGEGMQLRWRQNPVPRSYVLMNFSPVELSWGGRVYSGIDLYPSETSPWPLTAFPAGGYTYWTRTLEPRSRYIGPAPSPENYVEGGALWVSATWHAPLFDSVPVGELLTVWIEPVVWGEITWGTHGLLGPHEASTRVTMLELVNTPYPYP